MRDRAPRSLAPGLALGVAGILLLGAGCQRVGMEPPSPSGQGSEQEVLRPTPPQSLEDGVRRGTPASLPPLPALDVTVEGIDPILHAPVGQDRHLRERAAFWMDFWTTRSRDHFQRYLERMGEYQGLIDAELEVREMPASLRYLPVVESGYHHSITSRVGATGLWQLMRPTARGLGLTVDGVVDDRRDPVASTVAALDYLEELHARFDSWVLALSAYNAGPGRVSRALSRYAPDATIPPDERFLRIRAHLPAETREFVPRFFAAAVLASNPERHGFDPPDPARALAYDEVVVPDATSLDVVAMAAEVEEDEIARLNPQFMRRFTPAGQQRIVRVPLGLADTFERNFALIPPEERLSFLEHPVARGETLTHIARRYGVRVSELDGANGGLDPRRLQIGQRLVVPVGGRGAAPVRVAQATPTPTGEFHRVRSGDTWGGIARRYGVSTAELARVNGRTIQDVIRVGEALRIP